MKFLSLFSSEQNGHRNNISELAMADGPGEIGQVDSSIITASYSNISPQNESSLSRVRGNGISLDVCRPQIQDEYIYPAIDYGWPDFCQFRVNQNGWPREAVEFARSRLIPYCPAVEDWIHCWFCSQCQDFAACLALAEAGLKEAARKYSGLSQPSSLYLVCGSSFADCFAEFLYNTAEK
ncbi:MAG: hypothetical protein LBJ14_07945 [Desulfarculales bacterium]|jgi:hypothetical protein|nr:hypothetical protein [Desulfarculales bacterium]